MKYKKQTIVISLFLTIFFVLISTPWIWGNEYFGDSVTAWVIYYLVGSVITFYVNYVFIRAMIILVNHTCEQFKVINKNEH